MSLMQVLTRDSFQSPTTPYAFLGSSSFIQESRDNTTPDHSLYFPTSRDRTSITASDVSGASDHYLGSTETAEDLKLSSTSDHPNKNKPAWSDSTSQAPHQAQQQSMNNMQHVAQQSRREKLRIPGSLQQPASPQSGNHSDHSGGSLVLEMRQGASDIHHHHAENMESSASLRGYGGNPSQDMLAVYNNPMLAPELYSYTTNTEILNAVSGKNSSQGYILSGDAQAPQNFVAYQHQGGFNPNQGTLLQPSPNAPGASGGGISATLLVGSGLQGGAGGAFGSTTGRDLGSYFTGSGQAAAGGAGNAQEAMQLYLMNAAGYAAGFPDGSGGGGSSMVFIPGSGQQLSGGPNAQNLIGIPLHGSQNSLSQSSQVTSVSNSPVGYNQSGRNGASGGGAQAAYTGWKNGDELVFMPGSERAGAKSSLEGVNDFSDQYGASIAGQQQAAAVAVAAAGLHHVDSSQTSGAAGFQGLSLSLSSQQPQSIHAYDVLQQSGLDSPAALSSQDGKRSSGQIGGKMSADLSHFRRDFAGAGKPMHMDSGASTMSASFNIISSSRYLKACQQLLEEVCSVGRGNKQGRKGGVATASGSQKWTSPPLTSPNSTNTNNNNPVNNNKDGGTQDDNSQEKDGPTSSGACPAPAANASNSTSAGAANPSANATTTATNSAAPAAEGGDSASTLTSEERQELETKKSKLVAMLQEVERRYRQYYDQMQVVISSFDAVAGVGAATPYTALALQAMSRYFRCLKDAITGQISLVCKSLGEEDISKQITTKSPTSRLRFIDQQIRQQRAFQQLGMLNQHAWRPQRGLPERSVSILRAWLFEHFLHPYPKDADKMMLARQTGLTRSQVSNWFINARVRLWKPMVEEMYQEETREHELDAAVSRLHAAATADQSDDGSNPSGHGGEMKMSDQSGMNDPLKSSKPNDGTSSQQQQQQDHSYDSGAQIYDDSQANSLKKSRYTPLHDSDMLISSSSTHMDVDLKPDTSHEHHQHHHHGLEGLGAMNNLHHHHQHQNFGAPAGFDSLRFAPGATTGFRFNPGSGVSLTLGLQHSDHNLSHQFLQQQGNPAAGGAGFNNSRGGSGGSGGGEHDFSSLYDAAGLHHDGMSYTSRKHMESQLLHDFVPS